MGFIVANKDRGRAIDRGRVPHWILLHIKMTLKLSNAEAVDVLPCSFSRDKGDLIRGHTYDFTVLVVERYHIFSGRAA
jgi:hypothetical protein